MDIVNKHSKSKQSGMTMIELVVVLAIVAMVSSVLIFNYSGFRNTVTLRGLSQEIALSIRKAQTYATSVRSVEGVALPTTTFPGYGISFSIENDTSANPATPSKMQFVLFADIPDGSGNTDGMYNNGGNCGSPDIGDECVESFTIKTPDRIIKLCAEADCSILATDILFDRPAPDAIGCVIEGGACSIDRPSYIDIIIQAVSGDQRTITVWNTGQISVQ